MKCNSFKKFFEVMSNQTRLDIIDVLKEKELSVNEIVEKTGLEQSKVSHNLKILTRCNVLECRVEGKKRIYSINNDTIVPLIELVQKHVSKNCNKCWIKEEEDT